MQSSKPDAIQKNDTCMDQKQIEEIILRTSKHNYCDVRGFPITSAEQAAKEIKKLHEKELEELKEKIKNDG